MGTRRGNERGSARTLQGLQARTLIVTLLERRNTPSGSLRPSRLCALLAVGLRLPAAWLTSGGARSVVRPSRART